ncbi:MAG: RDD family protein [Bacteriovorax sp.]|nr:RDD family protein [Bacteriovorax sp.]
MLYKNDLLKKRVYALTMDLFIIVITNYFLMASFTNFLKTVFFSFPLHMQLFLIHRLGALSSITLMSLTFAYFSVFYFVTNGRTLGKTVFGIKVATYDKREMTIVQSMKRALAYFFCAMMGSFLFALSFFREDQKSLADLFSQTKVDYDQKHASDEDFGTEFQLTLLETIKKDEDESFDKKMAS